MDAVAMAVLPPDIMPDIDCSSGCWLIISGVIGRQAATLDDEFSDCVDVFSDCADMFSVCADKFA